jgi:hypothetical protein
VHGRYHCQRAGRGDVFNTTSDGAGQPFDGARAYTMRFEPGALPQVNGFWSITMYDPTFNFPPHAINRYAIGDRTPGLKRDADGGLTLHPGHIAVPGQRVELVAEPGKRIVSCERTSRARTLWSRNGRLLRLPEIGRFQVSRAAAPLSPIGS